ncbi:MAG TPA: SH3 domain-containing protein [Gammaproteobacteria bacterium]
MLCLIAFGWCCSPPVVAEEELVRLQVADPFIDLRTGPGRGFPVFHVVERHDWIDIIKRRTDWFRVRASDGKEGWAYIEQMEQTLALPGKRTEFAQVKQEDFLQRQYEFGAMAGDFEGAALMSVYTGFSISRNLSAELVFSQASGTFTNSLMLSANIVSSPFPHWRVSPFFSLGGGVLRNEPKGTFVQSAATDDATASAGLGFKAYLTRRFVFRAEVREVVAFLDDNNNGEFIEWKFGFSFFF